MKNLIVQPNTFRGLSARLAAVACLTAVFTAAPFHTASAQVAPTGQRRQFRDSGCYDGDQHRTDDHHWKPRRGSRYSGHRFSSRKLIGGAILGPGGDAALAQLATTAAYINLAGQACPVSNTFAVPTDLSGMTLVLIGLFRGTTPRCPESPND